MKYLPRLDTGFLIPVVDDKLYVAQRGTPPYQNYWGPIGGKSDAPCEGNPWDKPHQVEKLGGHLVIGIADSIAIEEGREHIQGTVVREFCEEIFSERNFPEDFKLEDVTDIKRLGFIADKAMVNGVTHDVHNYFYLARVNRKDFSLSKREILGFKPLEELGREDEIFPIGKLALAQIYISIKERSPPYLQGYEGLVDQIRPIAQRPGFIRPADCRFTSMIGLYTIPGYGGCIVE